MLAYNFTGTTTYHEDGQAKCGFGAVNTASSSTVDHPHVSMPAAEAAWKASVPDAAVGASVLLCVRTAVVCISVTKRLSVAKSCNS